MGSTPTTTTVDVDAARELISAALSTYAEVVSDQLDRSDDPAADQSDLVLLAELAGNVTGWTHTTRLREFLQAHAPRAAA